MPTFWEQCNASIVRAIVTLYQQWQVQHRFIIRKYLLYRSSGKLYHCDSYGKLVAIRDRVFRVTPQTANGGESRYLVLAVTFAVSGSLLNLGSSFLR